MAISITHKSIAVFLLSLAVLITAGCGFHLRGVTQLPSDMKLIILDSSDPFGPLTRAVEQELRANGISVSTDPTRTDIPSLRLLSARESRSTASIYRDGITAEYQLVMTVQAQVMFPGKGLYPLNAKIFRSFFDNPLTALAKDAEHTLLQSEMRQQAAQQLIRRLMTVHNDAMSGKLDSDTAQQQLDSEYDEANDSLNTHSQAVLSSVNTQPVNSNQVDSVKPTIAEAPRKRSALLPLLEPVEE